MFPLSIVLLMCLLSAFIGGVFIDTYRDYKRWDAEQQALADQRTGTPIKAQLERELNIRKGN